MRPLLTARQTFDRKTSNEDGFTLIELMVVIVVIGVLAAIAIPIFANHQREAIIATVKSDVRASVAASVQRMSGGSVFVDEEGFLSSATASDGNSVVLVVTNRGPNEIGCIWGSHVFGENDVVSFYYSSADGKISDGSCLSEDPANSEVIVGTNPDEYVPEEEDDHAEETVVVTPPVTSTPPVVTAPVGSVGGETTVVAPTIPKSKNKYPVCHGTGDNHKLLMLPLPAFIKEGHSNHSEDVIPPIAGVYGGKNWDVAGWKIFQEQCS